MEVGAGAPRPPERSDDGKIICWIFVLCIRWIWTEQRVVKWHGVSEAMSEEEKCASHRCPLSKLFDNATCTTAFLIG